MQNKLTTIFYGFNIFVVGCLACGYTIGILRFLSPLICATIFSGISILTGLMYLMNGIKNWGMLFPTGIFAALAFIVSKQNSNPEIFVFLLPFGIAFMVPFLVAVILDSKKNWWAMIPVGAIILLTSVIIFEKISNITLASTIILMTAAIIFAIIYVLHRVTWAILSTCFFSILAITVSISYGSLHLFAVPFVFLSISILYFGIYLRHHDNNQWAIIPAGILFTLSVLAGLFAHGNSSLLANNFQLSSSVMLLGIAITFGFYWLKENKPWAGLIAFLAIISAVMNQFCFNLFYGWPILILASGIFLYCKSFRSSVFKAG